jgi:hypothetical protein
VDGKLVDLVQPRTVGLLQTTTWKVGTGFNWTTPPCGAGLYYCSPGSFWYDGVGWRGAFTFTGNINIT